MASTKQRYRLFNEVLKKSNADEWDEAVKEWRVGDYMPDEDETASETCVCGHRGIRYLYKVVNELNGNVIEPIGSCCIKKFGRSELNRQVKAIREIHDCLENGSSRDLSIFALAQLVVEKVLNQREFNFLIEVACKRYLSVKQYKWREAIFSRIDEQLKKRTDKHETTEQRGC